MLNFENKLSLIEKLLASIRGIFDKHGVEIKLKEIDITLQQENFWKDKKLVKKTIKQKIFEDILNFYKSSLIQIDDIKDLFKLAQTENNDEIINDCNQKIDKIKRYKR